MGVSDWLLKNKDSIIEDVADVKSLFKSKRWVEAYLKKVRVNINRKNQTRDETTIIKNNKLVDVYNKILSLKETTKTVADIDNTLKKFKWTADPLGGLIDYSPNMYTIAYHLIVNQKLLDDCDGAARYAHYLYRFMDDLNGTKTQCNEVVLCPTPLIKGLKDSHVIFVVKTDDKFTVYSNGKKDAKQYTSLRDYCDSYYANKYDDYVIVNMPKNNMDKYLQKRCTLLSI